MPSSLAAGLVSTEAGVDVPSVKVSGIALDQEDLVRACLLWRKMLQIFQLETSCREQRRRCVARAD